MMRVTLEATDKFVTLVVNGADVPSRVWQGYASTDADGGIAQVPIHAYITRIAVDEKMPKAFHEAFAQELKATAPMRPEIAAIPLRLVL